MNAPPQNAPAGAAAGPRQETVDAITRVLRETLRLGPEARIEPDTPLVGGEHDLDSLDTLLLITTLEKQFGVKLFEAGAAGTGSGNGGQGRGTIDRGAFASVKTLARYVDSKRA